MESQCEWRCCTPRLRHELTNIDGQDRGDKLSDVPRQRATAIVVRDGRVLLVRDKGRSPFMLPGGGIDDGELPEDAVARELSEETMLNATDVRYLFEHGGKYNRHHVFSVDAEGEVDVSQDPLVVEFVWWDGDSNVLMFPHVGEILRRAGIMERRIRRRATAIVIRDGKVLLLREPQESEFELPGGGVEDGELPADSVERELREETGLTTVKADYLFEYCDFRAAEGGDYWGRVHTVFGVKAAGDVVLGDEHCEYAWWDGTVKLPLFDYVEPMLEMLQGANEWSTQE